MLPRPKTAEPSETMATEFFFTDICRASSGLFARWSAATPTPGVYQSEKSPFFESFTRAAVSTSAPCFLNAAMIFFGSIASKIRRTVYYTGVKQDDPIEKHFTRLKPEQKRALHKLRIRTVRDLLYHFPSRYERSGPSSTIAGTTAGAEVTLYGTIRKPDVRKTWKSRRPVAEAWLEDATGKMKMMWFSQPYIAKSLHDGMVVKVSGRVSGQGSKAYLANPEIDRSPVVPDAHDTLFSPEGRTADVLASLYPIYPESQGISSLWFTHNIRKVVETGAHEKLVDPVPKEILQKFNLPSLSSAIVFAHMPRSREDATAARKRFAFEEIFSLQLAVQQRRGAAAREHALPVSMNRKALHDFVESFPFPATAAQTRAIEQIIADFEKPHPMMRLLEGAVGSGKTAVAAATAYLVATSLPKGRI